jgi:hypothetical protein
VHQEHVEEMEEGLEKTKLSDEEEDDAWEIEKDVHLDGEGEARGRYGQIRNREGKVGDLKRMVPVSSFPTE